MKHLIRGRLKIESSMIFFGPFFLCSFTFFFPTACVGFGWRFLRSGSIKKKFSQKKKLQKKWQKVWFRRAPIGCWQLFFFVLDDTFFFCFCTRVAVDFFCLCVCVFLRLIGFYRVVSTRATAIHGRRRRRRTAAAAAAAAAAARRLPPDGELEAGETMSMIWRRRRCVQQTIVSFPRFGIDS